MPPPLSDHLAAELGGLAALLAARTSACKPGEEQPPQAHPEQPKDPK